MKNFVENKTLVFFIKFFIVILILIAIFVFYDDILNLFIKKDNENVENFNSLDVNNTGNSVNTVSEEISPVNFNLVATGDILCHNTQYFDAYDSSTGTYDFNYVFDDVVKYSKYLLSILLFETTIGKYISAILVTEAKSKLLFPANLKRDNAFWSFK